MEHDDLPAIIDMSGLGPLLDCPQAAAQVLSLDSENVTDVLEGEDPAIVVALDPLLGVVEELLPSSIACSRQLAEHIDGVLEHCDHQAALTVILGPARNPVEVLRGEHGIWREEAGDPFLCSRCDVAIFH